MSDEEESDFEYEYDSDEQYASDEAAADAGEEGGGGEGGGAGSDARAAARNAHIELENTFYEAEDFRQRGQLDEAMEYYGRVVALESGGARDSSRWSFPAYEQLVKLSAAAKRWDSMVANYRLMLAHLAAVTRNESTAAVSSVLDVVSAAAAAAADSDASDKHALAEYTSQMYELTLERLKDANNERLWFGMKIKLGKLYLDMHAFEPLEAMLSELYAYCGVPHPVESSGASHSSSGGGSGQGSLDHGKASLLMDVYALDIQMCGATKNSARMRTVYPKTLDLEAAAIADPRSMGIIREEGGKMYLEQGEWLLAYNELFASFRNHQEAGNARAVQVLKYAVLANMLAGSVINPFDSREAKVYQDVTEIGAMLLLRSAYDTSDIAQFEKVLRGGSSGSKLLRDPVMARYVDPLLRNLRCRMLKKLAKPYDVLTLQSLASSLHIAVADAEELAVALIQDDELDARIDQTRGLLVLSNDGQRRRQRAKDSGKMFDAIDRWTRALDSAHGVMVARVGVQQ